MIAESARKGVEQWKEEGAEEGRRRGRRTGRAQAQRQAIVKILATRFGAPTPRLRQALDAQSDPDPLDHLLGEALTAPSLEAFTALLRG